jgi:hypothetical protein
MANEDPEYLRFVRMLRCSRCCNAGGAQAHHVGKHAMSKRNHDWLAVPLCAACHKLLHDGQMFGAPDARREAELRWVAHTISLYVKGSETIPF